MMGVSWQTYERAFFGLIIVMSSILADEVVRASVLTQEVVANERRLRSLLQDVQLLVIGIDRSEVCPPLHLPTR